MPPHPEICEFYHSIFNFLFTLLSSLCFLQKCHYSKCPHKVKSTLFFFISNYYSLMALHFFLSKMALLKMTPNPKILIFNFFPIFFFNCLSLATFSGLFQNRKLSFSKSFHYSRCPQPPDCVYLTFFIWFFQKCVVFCGF